MRIWHTRVVLGVTTLGLALLVSGSASAHDRDDDGFGHWQLHRGLERQHDDGHDWLGDEHRAEHRELANEHDAWHYWSGPWADPWEHARLHRALEREHDQDHDQLGR